MLAAAIILGVLCLMFLVVLIWRAYETDRREREEKIVKQAFPKGGEKPDA